MKDFSPAYGIVPPLLTPFHEDKSIDWEAFDRLIDWHVERGVSGLFVPCGSSEYWRLTEDEAIQLATAAARRANGRINIVSGSTNYADDDLAKNIAMTKRMWNDAGVQGCFITTPRTIPAEDGPMLDYHRKIHDATTCPFYIYEMPGGTNYKFSAAAFAEVGTWERSIGIKDTTCDLEKVRAKLAAAKGSIKIMEANTPNLLNSFMLGSVGAINTSANVAPGLFAKLYALHQQGDVENAQALHTKIVEIDHMMSAGYVLSAKIAVSMMGVPMKWVCRNPSKEITPERIEELKAMVRYIEETEKEYAWVKVGPAAPKATAAAIA